jgi:hypothetical protein
MEVVARLFAGLLGVVALGLGGLYLVAASRRWERGSGPLSGRRSVVRLMGVARVCLGLGFLLPAISRWGSIAFLGVVGYLVAEAAASIQRVRLRRQAPDPRR